MLIEHTASMICGMSRPEAARRSVVRELMDGPYSEEAFRCLFERYHHAVSSFFSRKGLSPEDRRDLTQEVFVAVHGGIKNLRNEHAFVPWLFSIANHVALRHWERERSRPKLQPRIEVEGEEQEHDGIEQVAASDPDPETQMLDSERVRAVQKALETLPSQMKACLRGRIFEGLSNIEIAKRLGISQSTVAVHIHRGIEALKAHLEQYCKKQPFAGDF